MAGFAALSPHKIDGLSLSFLMAIHAKYVILNENFLLIRRSEQNFVINGLFCCVKIMLENIGTMARKNVLPPLGYLQAFEAAAKNQNFAMASRELGISESAVSRKIRLLEQHYEIALFERGHRSVALTQHGIELYDTVKLAMLSLREVSTKLTSKKSRREVTIAATNSVASLWLMPRLRKFNQANKQLNIMLMASDDDAECLGEGIDITILRGDGSWPDHTARKFFGEIIFPVCSPAFLAENPETAELETLLSLPLIEVSSGHAEWMNWSDWLSGHLPQVPDLTRYSVFNAYPHAVQAAVDGLGVALGWGHLVDHLLKSGELVRPLKKTHTRTQFGYFLLEPKKRSPHPECDIVKDWLLTESAARKHY